MFSLRLKNPGYLNALRVVAVALAFSVAVAADAQKPSAPKVQIFGGYSYIYPNATVTGTQPGGILPVSSCLCAQPRGFGAAVGFDFLPWLALTVDTSAHWPQHENAPADRIGQSAFYNVSAGPTFTYRTRHFSPFAEALFGEHRLAPSLFHHDDEFGIVAGGGLDINLNRHFAIRAVQADFVYSNHHFGINPSDPATNLRGIRLQAGVVFLFGGAAPKPAPVVVAPQVAEVIPPPVVVAPQPPTLTCSANPSTMNAGDSTTITAAGNSPANLPLTYSYQPTAGTITAMNSMATLSTTGATPGTITVNCNVVDSAGQTATASTAVTLLALPLAAKAMPQDLCTISFARDARRPVRVDNEAKACLDDVSLSLQRTTNSMLVLVGNADPAEHHSQHAASARAVNAKAYLVDEKGIDPARIQLYTGSANTKSVSTTLVPGGATFDAAGDTALKP